jgi:hypothetical protein
MDENDTFIMSHILFSPQWQLTLVLNFDYSILLKNDLLSTIQIVIIILVMI